MLVRLFKYIDGLPITTSYHRAVERVRKQVSELVAALRKSKDGEGLLLKLAEGDETTIDQMSKEDIISNSIILLFAGHVREPLVFNQLYFHRLTPSSHPQDTTAHMMSVAVWQLCSQPALYQRFEEEAERGETEFLEAVCKETLRMFAPANGSLRQAPVALTTPYGTINKGEFVYLSYDAAHYDPDVFHNPGKFNPDRFLLGSPGLPSSFFGFGQGPRSCIGQALAQLEARTVLSSLFRSFSIELVEPVSMRNGFTVHPDAVRVRLRKKG